MQRLNIPLRGQCSRRKIRHYSKALAEAQIYTLKSVGLGRLEDGDLRVFHCSDCCAFHIGHARRLSELQA